MKAKNSVLLVLIILACFLVLFYFGYYFVIISTKAGSGSVTLDSQADWQAGSYNARLDLVTSPGNIEINLLNPNWTRATATADWGRRNLHGSAVFDNKLWVLGGQDNTGTKYNDVWYSTDGAAWTQATADAGWSDRSVHNVLVYNNELWVFGGADSTDTNLNDVWHSANGVNWTQATAAAGWVARRAAGAVVFDSKMWIFGGWDAGDPATRYDDVWWSTDGSAWTLSTDAPGWTPRHAFAYSTFDNKIWLFGGDDTTLKSDIWYSANGTSWTEAAASSSWGGRIYFPVVSYGNRLWLMGGTKISPYYNNDVWYSSNGTSWTQTTNAGNWTARGNHCAQVFDDNIYITGGASAGGSGGVQSDVWYTSWLGQHTSAGNQIIASENITGWTTFVPQGTIPDGASISFNFRTSPDGAAWTGWSAAKPYAASIDISDQVGSNRYFQVVTTLTNDDGYVTPSVDSYTVNYNTSGSSPTPTPSPSSSSPDTSPSFSPTTSPDIEELPVTGLLDWLNPFSENKTKTDKIIYWSDLLLLIIIIIAIYFISRKKS